MFAFYTTNRIDTPALTWGCHWADGIVSPANPAWTAEELAFHLKDAGAKALVTQLGSLQVVREAARKVGVLEDRIILLDYSVCIFRVSGTRGDSSKILCYLAMTLQQRSSDCHMYRTVILQQLEYVAACFLFRPN